MMKIKDFQHAKNSRFLIMKKIILVLMLAIVVISGCAQQEVEIQPLVPEEAVEEATVIPEESLPIEREANNVTGLNPQQQSVTVNQPAVQETKVQKPKCSREFSPQFNAG